MKNTWPGKTWGKGQMRVPRMKTEKFKKETGANRWREWLWAEPR